MAKNKAWQGFEIFVRHFLLGIGFKDVPIDGTYVVSSKSLGKMINGLAEAHNADVLVDPPFQTPYFARTRLLVECKDYTKHVSIGIIRGAVGLREDINHFAVIDKNSLGNRCNSKKPIKRPPEEKMHYQIAVASVNGFSVHAHNYADVHRIILMDFSNYSYWGNLTPLLKAYDPKNKSTITKIEDYAKSIAKKALIGFLSTNKLILLYSEETIQKHRFETHTIKSIERHGLKSPWRLGVGNVTYEFSCPDTIMKEWLDSDAPEMDDSASSEVYLIVLIEEDNTSMAYKLCFTKKQIESAKDRLKEIEKEKIRKHNNPEFDEE